MAAAMVTALVGIDSIQQPRIALAQGVYLGDVNSDSIIDSSDASMILAEYALLSTGQKSQFTVEQKLAGDTDKNGSVDSVDASSILAYYAYVATGGSQSFMMFLNGDDSDKFDYSTITEQDVYTDNDYFTLKGNSLYADKAGYYGVVHQFDESISAVIGGIYQSFGSVEEAAESLVSLQQMRYCEVDGGFLTVSMIPQDYYIVYSEQGTSVDAVVKVTSEGIIPEEEEVAMPRFRVRYNEEKSKARTDGAAVYTVRAKIDFDEYTNWDDTSVPVASLPMLKSVSCRCLTSSGAKDASIEGFDERTTYDEFELYFFSNGEYLLCIEDTNNSYSTLRMTIAEVNTDVKVEDAYEGIDRVAPELSISVPDDKGIPDGSVVEVKVTSNEPCVMQIGANMFGTVDKPITEAIFEARYNGRFSVTATDLNHNTTIKSFNVNCFEEVKEEDTNSDESELLGDESNGKNPYNPSNRDSYWGEVDELY